MGLTFDWSESIQSVILFHFAPSHCRNFTEPPPSWSMQDTFSACMKPVAPSCLSFLSSMLRCSRPQRISYAVFCLKKKNTYAEPGQHDPSHGQGYAPIPQTASHATRPRPLHQRYTAGS